MKSKFLSILLILILMLSLTACNDKKNVSQSYDSLSDSKDTQSSDKEAFAIPNHVKETISGGGDSVEIDADVHYPANPDALPVVELLPSHFEDEDITKYADLFFDKDSYFLYMPYSKEQCELCKDNFTQLRNQSDDEEFIQLLDYKYIFQIDNLMQQATDEHIYDNYQFYMNADSDFQIDECVLMGTVNGILYQMHFRRNHVNSILEIRRMSEDFEITELSNDSYYAKQENVCKKYTQEQGLDCAYDELARLGLKDYANVHVTPAQKQKATWTAKGIYDIETSNDGYVYYFGRAIQDCTVPYVTFNYAPSILATTTFEDEYPEYEAASVYVDDYGVSNIFLMNPMTESSVLTKQSSLLSFDSILSIAMDYIQNDLSAGYGSQNVTEISLGYSYVWKDAKHVALVPAWYFLSNSNLAQHTQRDNQDAVYIINAIDGTVITKSFRPTAY